MVHVPIIHQIRQAAEDDTEFCLDASLCRSLVFILDQSTDMTLKAHKLVRLSRRAFTGGILVGLCLGLALPRLLLIMHSIVTP